MISGRKRGLRSFGRAPITLRTVVWCEVARIGVLGGSMIGFCERIRMSTRQQGEPSAVITSRDDLVAWIAQGEKTAIRMAYRD